MGNNLVSVIIPVYNTEKYLEKCVRSIMEQTYRKLEILLIDDGSTDGSGALCDKLACRDERIKVVHKVNGGAAAVRNLGIELATGEYILFLDSDDWLELDAVRVLVAHANQSKADIVRFNYVREYEGKSVSKKNTILEERIYSGEECKEVRRQILGLTGKSLLHFENMRFLASSGFNLYRRSLLVNSGVQFVPIQQIGSFVDGLFNFSVFSKVECFEFIDRPFYHYRKTNEGAATANYRKNYVNRQLILFEMLGDIIEEENSWDFYREAFQNHLVYSTMEIAFNALRNKAPCREKYTEIKDVLNHPVFVEAYKNFNLKYLGWKWKVYFFFVKHSMVVPTFLTTSVILKLKNRGTL